MMRAYSLTKQAALLKEECYVLSFAKYVFLYPPIKKVPRWGESIISAERKLLLGYLI